MKNIQYLIVFLLVVLISMQGYYIYNSETNKIEQTTKTTAPKKLLNYSSLKNTDLDKVFTSNPFEQMQKMEQDINKIFNSMNSQFSTMPEFEKFFKNDMSISPALNFKEYKDHYEFSVSIPGSEKNSINITTKDGILSIEAKTKKLKDENTSNFIKKEMYEGVFARSLTLPRDADTQKMKTKYKNGILKIILPKK